MITTNFVVVLCLALIAAASPVPIVDHWSEGTSRIRAHMNSRRPSSVPNTPARTVRHMVATAQPPQQTDAPLYEGSLPDASSSTSGDTLDRVAVEPAKVSTPEKLGGDTSASSAPSVAPAPTPALSEEIALDVALSKLLSFKTIFSAFLGDMEQQDLRRAALQGELVDVQCPRGGGTCETIFRSAAKGK
jgi:hypothetical protein